uniref:Cytochrome c oxidase subunit 2 n=1 Tax=Sycophila sp. 2 JXW-2020 TaxID=2781670 RepID=A0A8A3UX41_9HYME|nr:cytochrome c oxidase subunit II [Sycophila sp. 2 JXW-2020]
MAFWKQIMLQDAGSSVMESMILFYDQAMCVVFMIIILILYMLVFMIKNKFVNRCLLEGQLIEIVWTVIPMFLLIFLAIPSLKVLYLSDEINNPSLTFKVIAHQWYWEYEYNFISPQTGYMHEFENFDSMMNKNILLDSFRLLDVSENFMLPYLVQIRLIITSDDVIHSFAVPALGVKVDAVPGRLNQISILINRPGIYMGQCSEICGVNHSFMPIVLEVINYYDFLDL